MLTQDGTVVVGKFQFTSRLFVGTGKYRTFEEMREAIVASGTELVTVALRRVNWTIPMSLCCSITFLRE